MLDYRDVDHLLTMAAVEVEYLQTGDIFVVEDLFKPYQWTKIPMSDRLHLEKLFYDYYISGPSCRLNSLDKTTSNQQKYEVT